jgi:hypothetical protein
MLRIHRPATRPISALDHVRPNWLEYQLHSILKSHSRASLASLPIMADPDFSATHLSGFTNNKSIKSRWGFGAFISSLPALNSETSWSLTSPEISFDRRSSPINASMFLLKRLNSSL